MPNNLQKLALPLILKDRVVLKEGTWNGNHYPADEIKRLIPVLNAEPKDPSEKNRNSVFVGDAEDHQDSTGTWVGRAHKFYWDDRLKALVAGEIHIVDEETARKIAYQLSDRQGTSWGISPRLEVRKEGNTCRDIVMKSLALVLEPAGGEDLLLSRETVKLNSDKGRNDMELDEIRQIVTEAVVLEFERFRENLKDEIEQTRKETADKLKKLEESEEERKKREEEERKRREAEEKAKAEEKQAKKQPDEEEETDEEANKKASSRYPFNSGGKKLARPRHILPRKFNLKGFDQKALKRLSEDLADALSGLTGAEVTLAKYEDALSAIEGVLYGLPVQEPDAATLKRIESESLAEEESLNKKVEERVSKLIETLRSTKPERKGLVNVLLDNRGPAEETPDPREKLGVFLAKPGIPKQ